MILSQHCVDWMTSYKMADEISRGLTTIREFYTLCKLFQATWPACDQLHGGGGTGNGTLSSLGWANTTRSLKWKWCHFDEILSLAAPETVKVTAPDAHSDENLIMTFAFQLSVRKIILQDGRSGVTWWVPFESNRRLVPIIFSLIFTWSLWHILYSNPFCWHADNFSLVWQFTRMPRACFYSLGWRLNGRDSVSNDQPHDCLLNSLFRLRSKKTSKLRVTGLYAGNSPETGEVPAQRASTAENVSIWWRHHVTGFCWTIIQAGAWISNYVHTIGCKHSTMPYLQRRFSWTTVEVNAWMSN